MATLDSQLLAYDFYYFWAAGKVARSGGDPYDVSVLKPIMVNLGWPETERVLGFLNPFWTIWFFSGISLLPFPVAAIAWCVLIVGITLFSVWLISNSGLRERIGLRGPVPFLLYAAALFPPFISSVANGQSNVILLVGIVGWMTAAHRQRPVVSGALLSLTTFKPQLFLPLYVLVFASEFRRKEISSFVGFVSGLAVQAALSVAINPEILSMWCSAITRIRSSTTTLPTPTLSRMLSSWTGDPWWALYLVGAGSLLALVVATRQRGDLMQQALFFLPLSALTAPFVWAHAFLPLLPVYLLFIGQLAERSARGAFYVCAIFALFGICEIIRPHLLGPTMVCIPILLLTFMIGRRRQFFQHRMG